MIKIVTVVTHHQRVLFAKFPLKLYKGCPYYVPCFTSDEIVLTNPKKNHAAEGVNARCFLAYKEKKLVGRIAGVILPENRGDFNEKAVRFTRIDFIEDYEVAKALVDAVISFGKENGCTKIHGPWGFNDTDKEGMLTKGFDKVSTYAATYSYAYYPAFMEKMGFEKESEWIEMDIPQQKFEERHPLLIQKLSTMGLKEISGTMPIKKVIQEYGDRFFDCYNRAYSKLDGFFPIEGKAKENVIQQFATIINDKYFSLIEDTNSHKVVAFGVGIADISPILVRHRGRLITALPSLIHEMNHPRRIEMLLLGVDPDYLKTGVHALVLKRMTESVVKYHIEKISINPMLTTNTAILSSWHAMHPVETKRRQTYIKKI